MSFGADEGSSPVSEITEEGYGHVKVPLSIFCWVLGWGLVSQLPYVLYYVGVKSMLMRNANPRGPMCFRYLMFSLSGHCELLFLLLFH